MRSRRSSRFTKSPIKGVRRKHGTDQKRNDNRVRPIADPPRRLRPFQTRRRYHGQERIRNNVLYCNIQNNACSYIEITAADVALKVWDVFWTQDFQTVYHEGDEE